MYKDTSRQGALFAPSTLMCRGAGPPEEGAEGRGERGWLPRGRWRSGMARPGPRGRGAVVDVREGGRNKAARPAAEP